MKPENNRRRSQKRGCRAKDKSAFIAALESGALIHEACKEVGISTSQAYQWRREDAQFAAQWADAVDQAMDALEGVVIRAASRAVDGIPGAAACAMFLLKARNPLRYCDKSRALRVQAEHEAERAKAEADASGADALASIVELLDQIADHKRAFREN